MNPDPLKRHTFHITDGTSRTWRAADVNAARPEKNIQSCISTAVPRPMFVPIAAPVTPSSGNGPMPKIRNGHTMMLMALPSHSIRIAIAGSPAPRKIALLRNSSVTVALPANITFV